MLVARLDAEELMEEWLACDPDSRMKSKFIAWDGSAPEKASVVSIQMDPGGIVPLHTDSVEELVLILEGSVEAWVEGERKALAPGALVAIPAHSLHGFRNLGLTPVKAVGFFSSASVVTIYQDTLMPSGERVFTHDSHAPASSE